MDNDETTMKVSATELPVLTNADSTYAIVDSIDHEDDWILGKIGKFT